MKIFRKIAIAIALVIAFAFPAQAVQQDMWAHVYKWDGGYNADGTIELTRLTSGVTFKVLAIDSDTAETLTYYNTAANTSLTNPVTTTNFADDAVCNDMVSFSVDPTDATNDRYVDLIVVNADGGYTTFYEDFDEFAHTIVIDQRAGVPHTGCVWFNHTVTTVQDTGIDFEYDTLIKDVRVEVVEVASTATIDVGFGVTSETSYDADCFRDGVSLTTAGFIVDTAITTTGTSVDYTPDSTYGDFLYSIDAGDGNLAETMNTGGRTYLGHVVTGANALSLTYSVTSTASGEGYIFYEMVRMR